jgi:large subunit ribosomal protein L24
MVRAKKKLKAMRRAERKHSRPRIRRDDRVQVIAGADKGKVGRVLRVLVSRQRVVVEGVNKIFKHVRKSQQNPQGGRVEREGSIHISNVMLLNDKSGKGERVRVEVGADGKKTRVFKSGGAVGK